MEALLIRWMRWFTSEDSSFGNKTANMETLLEICVNSPPGGNQVDPLVALRHE